MPQLSLHSPVGDITIFEDGGAIVSLDWGWVTDQVSSSLLDHAKTQLEAYFDQDLMDFDLPLAPRGTPYRRRVWTALRGIPHGETKSYQQIADKVGGSARSVGQANSRNPIPLIIPCHRVVAATHIGGYSGGDGLTTKRWLLALENRRETCFETPVSRRQDMTKAIRIHANGGPEVMVWEDIPTPEPGPGEALVKHEAVGLNFIDVYFRTGLYKAPNLPLIIGQEGAGTVLAVGAHVTDIAVGDRVVYAGPLGGYATERVITADRLVKLPDNISFQTAAAMMLQGMTAQYLLRRTYKVKSGDTIVVHAAAGGVGLIMCQWAKHLGATVIGVVSSPEKAELARAHGAAHTALGHASLAADVKRITAGAMVPVVYDSVGKDTFMASLDCLAPLGLMASYGNASGPVPPVELGLLAAKGSLFLTRPTLATYTAKRSALEQVAADLFDVVGSGAVKIQVNQTFSLKDAGAAHAALEARKTTGSTVLLP